MLTASMMKKQESYVGRGRGVSISNAFACKTGNIILLESRIKNVESRI